MDEISCAICGPQASFGILYSERIPQGENIVFASRRDPDRVHFRIVRCNRCRLIYSNPIFSIEQIKVLYKKSKFINEPQSQNRINEYQNYLFKILPLIKRKRRILEVGCANGSFLKAALKLGFEEVWGVDPCEEAIKYADIDIRPRIINTFFKQELFEPESFDAVCFFQVLDHSTDPNVFLQDVHKVLCKGGILLTINHNTRSLITRILGERSSMYDIGHIFLFDQKTMRMILEKNGFEVITISNLANSYTIEYCLKMFPLPKKLRRLLLRATHRLANHKIKLRAGNMISIARK